MSAVRLYQRSPGQLQHTLGFIICDDGAVIDQLDPEQIDTGIQRIEENVERT
eukprot:CAMPEP_0183826488 /NCGR_PEP_ID=MMETSP0807_2-20130328/1726_1 /TAXON_ID=88271 /ORGANISM="Picocystis salinarum, Strain CCMP1897" /LENGTH=51 /DNA_ID=CAMNT_0026071609 /DNA_START=1613 /DNA_END=1768 /DNA_ORIENTATION=+